LRLWFMPLVLSFRPAHWMSRMLESTVGTIFRRLSVAKVLVWSSDTVVGGGVLGGLTSSDAAECLRPCWKEFT
jgi:hypothetical protein